MAIKRIPCGGFFYDDESIEFDGDVMKVIGGGASLPEVTAEDNGDVLTVVGGEWAKAPSGSGANDFLVTFSMGSDDSIVSDKSYAEVVEAEADNKIIHGILDYGEGEAKQSLPIFTGRFDKDMSFLISEVDIESNEMLFSGVTLSHTQDGTDIDHTTCELVSFAVSINAID